MVATEEAYETHVRRYVDVADTLGGVALGAFFDGDAGGTVVSALDAYTTMDPPGDPSPPRTLSQRRADALVEISAEVLARKERAGRPRSQHRRGVRLPDLVNRELGDLSTRLCEITGVGPVARAVMERFCCNSRIGRIVMQGKSVVLDQGRRTPTVTPEQRRALAHRDRGCVFPGCDRPPPWTDAHHVEFWVRDEGPTDLDNLVLLCRRHHVLCHEGRWTLERAPDGTVTATRPEGRARARAPAQVA